MINLVIDSSRYLMIFLIAIYTYLNFRFFGVSEDKKKKICRRQNITMFFLHFLAYAVIYLQTEDERMLMFYGAQVLFFVCYIYLYRLFYRRVSRLLVNNMCILLTVGFIILTRLDFNKAVRQFVIVVVSALLTWMIPFILDRVWQLSKIPWVYGILGLILLAAVCVIGNRSYGAQLSLNIRGMTVQPSEFVKISFVFFVATMFYRAIDFKTVVITTLVAALHILILVLSKDLGSALIFVLTYLFMLFAATSNWFYLGGGLLSVCAASPLAYHLFPHVRIRVAAWRNP
ncbi:MAG: FtsW/RodA/SpoVE family cell cycle protein, partial [Hungatella sp.]